LLIPKLIDVLRDSNIEDLDLSKVAAKALHNLNNMSWSNEHLKKLDEILTSLGEELDSIMVRVYE
jgi:flagellin-specific chaperone FliS